MATFKATYSKWSSSGSVKYALHRKQELERDHHQRTAFTGYESGLDTKSALQEMEQAEQDGKGYTYRLVLNPGEGHDTPVDMQQWTRDTMRGLEQRLDKPVTYMAVVHDDHAEHTHVHIIAHLDKTMRKDDLNHMRAVCTNLYEQQKQMHFEVQNDTHELHGVDYQRHQERAQLRAAPADQEKDEGSSGKGKAGGREAENEGQEKASKQRQRDYGLGY